MPRTCLIVDDSRVIRKVARRILEAHGYEVAEVENGEQALRACQTSLPHCILLDWNMPVMNGLEFLKQLRAEFGPDKPAVVFCTTESEMEAIATAIEAGAQEYIMTSYNGRLLPIFVTYEVAER